MKSPDKIVISAGKIWIPRTMLDRRSKMDIPGCRWSAENDCWFAYHTTGTTTVINQKFGTKLPVPVIDVNKVHFPFKLEPFRHQLEALATGAYKPSFAYLMERGTGKTKVVIDNVQILHRDGLLNGLLVLCTKSGMGAWIKEIKNNAYYGAWDIYRWNYGWVNHYSGPESDRLNKKIRPSVGVLIMNIDAINTDDGYKTAYGFMVRHQAMLCVDQSETIKNTSETTKNAKGEKRTGSLRSSRACNLGQYAKYKRITTGSPISKNPLDMYGQFYFLDPQIFFGWSYYAFRAHFAVLGGYKDKQIIAYHNLEEMAEIVAPFSYRVTKAECLDLPPKTYTVHEIELGEKARTLYDKIADDLVKSFNIDGDEVSFEHAMTRVMKLRQICGGSMIITETGEIKTFDDAKIKDTMDIINECDTGGVLVWCQFTHEVKRLKEVLADAGIDAGEISGRVVGSKRDQFIEDYEKGKIKVLVCQNDAGSDSITLNATSIVVFYSNSNKYRIRAEAEDRAHRIGQKKNVLYIDLVVPKSVDVSLLRALKKNKGLSDIVLNAISKQHIINLVRPQGEIDE